MSKFSEDLVVMQAKGFKLNGNKVSFPVYHLDIPIEDLNLSVRAMNGLKRAGIFKADELLNVDISRMRNLGVKSVKEIKNALLNYSYEHMTQKQRADFWREVLV